MIYERKLKSNKSIAGFFIPIGAFLVLGIISVLYGLSAGLDAMGGYMLIVTMITFISYLKTKNKFILISVLYIFLFSILLFKLEPATMGPRKFALDEFGKLLLIFIMFLWICLMYSLFTKKFKWRGREIMELAARNAEPSDDSYTERPRPVGKAEYRKGELLEFADFLSSNHIALTYLETEQILFLPVKMGKEYNYLFNPNMNFTEQTWVAFDFDGNVTSHISRADYLDYKENLSHDILLKTLGELYIEFFELYQKGEKSRVIDKLNEEKIGIFS